MAVQGDEPDAPFIPRCHRRIISPRARPCNTQHNTIQHTPALLRFVQYNSIGSLRGARNKHTASDYDFEKSPRDTPHTLSFGRASTIYGRYGKSLKNECAVRWRLCMIKKSCLLAHERARLPTREEEGERMNSSRGFNQRALLTPDRTA